MATLQIPLRLGFTGTREGMTDQQKDKLILILDNYAIDQLHHGDCVGADEFAHNLAKNMGIFVVVHPPIDPRLRAWCVGDETREPLPYIERNHNIVDETGHLFVAPRTKEEQVRSGTWATYRYAKSMEIPIWKADP